MISSIYATHAIQIVKSATEEQMMNVSHAKLMLNPLAIHHPHVEVYVQTATTNSLQQFVILVTKHAKHVVEILTLIASSANLDYLNIQSALNAYHLPTDILET